MEDDGTPTKPRIRQNRSKHADDVLTNVYKTWLVCSQQMWRWREQQSKQLSSETLSAHREMAIPREPHIYIQTIPMTLTSQCKSTVYTTEPSIPPSRLCLLEDVTNQHTSWFAQVRLLPHLTNNRTTRWLGRLLVPTVNSNLSVKDPLRRP